MTSATEDVLTPPHLVLRLARLAFRRVGTYDRHLNRMNEDTAYADGVDYGHTGGTADSNPWAIGDDRRVAWAEGWRVGAALLSFDAARDDIASELQRLVDAGELII